MQMGNFLNMTIKRIKKIIAIVALILEQLLANHLKKMNQKFYNIFKKLINKRFHSKIYQTKHFKRSILKLTILMFNQKSFKNKRNL